MGTVSRTDVGGLFIGNTAEMILGRLNCSVLAVKPPAFRTPVSLEQPTTQEAAYASCRHHPRSDARDDLSADASIVPGSSL